MGNRYRLSELGNDQLVEALSGLVRRENDLLSDVLAHLAELDERRLYLDLGYTSVFAYCTEALGLCKSSAGRRIAAARVCLRYPEAFVRVAEGQLQLSVLSLLGQYLKPDNAAELFDACSRKRFEQVELLLAARFPKPDVRDLIRRLPARSQSSAPDVVDVGSRVRNTASASDASSVEESDSAATTGATAPTPAPILTTKPTPTPTPGRVEPLSADRFGVHFTADAEFRELLEEVRALASHQQPRGELLPLMKRALLAYRRELRKARYALSNPPTSMPPLSSPPLSSPPLSSPPLSNPPLSSPPLSNPPLGNPPPAARAAYSGLVQRGRTRYVPAAVRRAVYLRDDGRCTFCSNDGRRCGTRRFLELDHVLPWAETGPSTLDNLRLRCRAHNQHSARVHFGSEYVARAVARERLDRAPDR